MPSVNLVEVGPTPAFRVTCVRCGFSTASDRSVFYANTEGKPWHDYYCRDCARLITGEALPARIPLPSSDGEEAARA